MTQVMLSALRSVDSPGAVTRALTTTVSALDRVTLRGHMVGATLLAVVPHLAVYAFTHPLVGCAIATLLPTPTVRRAIHRLAGVCLRAD